MEEDRTPDDTAPEGERLGRCRWRDATGDHCEDDVTAKRCEELGRNGWSEWHPDKRCSDP